MARKKKAARKSLQDGAVAGMDGAGPGRKRVAAKKTVAEVPTKGPANVISFVDEEGKRFAAISASWPKEEVVRVLLGWMGINRARQMNDFLETRLRGKS